jgi:hypothetical protein
MDPSPGTVSHGASLDPQATRTCGAACLSRAYRSFGKEISQDEIWPLIAKRNRFGSVASTTHLMALHALKQGLSAVVIQARHPIQVLRICSDNGIRAILNHRPQPEVSTGHFTMLVDIDEKDVVVSDPAVGPWRRLSHSELLQLWLPQSPDSEIAGNVLIGIAAEPVEAAECEFCHTRTPSKIDCPRCKQVVGLNPSVLLGCIRDGCIARMWNYVACPSCDFMWSFTEAGTSTGDRPRPAAPDTGAAILSPPDLDPVFAQLDKFCAHMLGNPGAADHPDLKAQIDFIQGNKNKLRQAQAEEVAGLNAHIGGLAAATEDSKKNQEVRRKTSGERNAPLPRLDGDALGQALLKNLGFK